MKKQTHTRKMVCRCVMFRVVTKLLRGHGLAKVEREGLEDVILGVRKGGVLRGRREGGRIAGVGDWVRGCRYWCYWCCCSSDWCKHDCFCWSCLYERV